LLTYIARRMLILIPILLGVSIISFAIAVAMPGDILNVMVSPTLGEKQMEMRREELGLNKPIYVRYFQWLRSLASGSLGYSMLNNEPVLDIIARRIGPTLILTGTALVISLIIAIPAGIISAIKQYSFLDYILTFGAFAGISIPTFFLGLFFIYIFSIQLGWLPAGGMKTLGTEGFSLIDLLRHLIMPATVLGFFGSAMYMRYMRSSLLEVLQKDYIDTARAKGLSELKVIIFHGGRNALIPIITLLGVRLRYLFGGAVLIETVFAWPGMGRLLVDSVFQRDSTVIVGLTLLTGLMVVLGNLIADITYSVVDPRIRYN